MDCTWIVTISSTFVFVVDNSKKKVGRQGEIEVHSPYFFSSSLRFKATDGVDGVVDDSETEKEKGRALCLLESSKCWNWIANIGWAGDNAEAGPRCSLSGHPSKFWRGEH